MGKWFLKLFFIFINLIFISTEVCLAIPTESHAVSMIRIYKHERRLLVLDKKGNIIKSYYVTFGFNPVGGKNQEGDGRTPEGKYFIAGKNMYSRFHKSLLISYPNAQDRKRASAMHINPGSAIMIHGTRQFGWLGSFHKLVNWTKGCIALNNNEIDEIYSLVPVGTPVEIDP